MAQLTADIRRVSNADGAVLLDLRHGSMFRLNPLGSKIVDLLERGESPPHIAKQISAECDVPLPIAERDIEQFLDSLERHGVLDPRGPKR